MRRPLKFLAWSVGLVAFLFAWGYLNAHADPVVRRAEVALPDWPAREPPMRVVLLSDIHLGNSAMDARRLGRIIGQVNALKPDLVLIAGDFVAGSDHAAARVSATQLMQPLRGLRARLGTVATLGNHDERDAPDEVRLALAGAGIPLLENSATTRGPLLIGGLGDYLTGHQRIGATLRAMQLLQGAGVIMGHSPTTAPHMPQRVALVLAGHTHCGQIVLPFYGPVLKVAPPRYMCGMVRDPGRTTIVSGGLGTSNLPLRYGAPPDLWLITLGPAAR